MLPLALALALAAADTVPVTGPATEPAVLVHRQPAHPVVALRLSLLADDPPGYAGAGHLLQHLVLPRLEERVGRVGGRVQAIRTTDAVVYTVVGPAAELDYLAESLRAALAPPPAVNADLLPALAALAQERDSEREVAPSYARVALRARLFPQALPSAGTPAGAERLATARLGDVWASMYRPERLSIIAVGAVEVDDVRRAFRELPAGATVSLPPGIDSIPPLAADTPQATRGWLARGWQANDVDPAALTVTARLLRNHLRRRMTRSAVEVEHWWTQHGQALALVVATPDSLVRVARGTLDNSLVALGETLTPELVRDAAAGVRREMLFFARTPERMAEVLGAFADRGEPADAAQRFYAAVEGVEVGDVREVLERLRARDVVSLEIPAQRITVRR